MDLYRICNSYNFFFEFTGNEFIKAASSMGFVSSVMDLTVFQKKANLSAYPVPIVVVTLEKEHVSQFSEVSYFTI